MPTLTEKALQKDLKRVREILDLALRLETNCLDLQNSQTEILQMQTQLQLFATSPEPNLRRLADIAPHLHPQMSLRELGNFMVPLERLIDRNLRDDEFLVTSIDQHKDQLQDLPDPGNQQQRQIQQLRKREIYFVLDHIRSAFNVGSIFRLAECVGASKLLLCGYTPTPEQRALQKTAMGTSAFIDYQVYPKTAEALQALRKQGIRIVGLETARNAQNLFSGNDLQKPTAFVVGNERFGLDRKILQLCDEVRFIPTFGVKNSLNVAQSLAIAAYEWSRQNC